MKSGRVDKHSLKYLLHKELSGHAPARTVRKLHASELLKEEPAFCPREHAILDELEKERPDEFVPTCDRVTWDLGNGFAEYIIDVLSRSKHVIGDWECLHCGKLTKWKPKPRKCKKCDHTHHKHIENRFLSKDCGASGGIDFFYWREDIKKYRGVEMKTMMKEQFKTLAAPLAEHKARTTLYLRIIEDSDHPHKDEIDTQVADILYLCKGGYRKDESIKLMGLKDMGMSPFETFYVKRNDALVETKWKHAKMLKKYRDDPRRKNVPLGLCPTSFCKRAKQCSVRDDCFSKWFNKTKGK